MLKKSIDAENILFRRFLRTTNKKGLLLKSKLLIADITTISHSNHTEFKLLS